MCNILNISFYMVQKHCVCLLQLDINVSDKCYYTCVLSKSIIHKHKIKIIFKKYGLFDNKTHSELYSFYRENCISYVYVCVSFLCWSLVVLIYWLTQRSRITSRKRFCAVNAITYAIIKHQLMVEIVWDSRLAVYGF